MAADERVITSEISVELEAMPFRVDLETPSVLELLLARLRHAHPVVVARLLRARSTLLDRFFDLREGKED